ncbi:glycosyltransferase [Hymenobacter sp. UV11]|uniref:glycosyltransferase family 2 protein n=1 Tax=Hymenobacter sp. UV11 TaxID=1849735 RepID=UPI00105C3B24|nr:glycosyltransferase [Hymenobacter sp. UV11]TDN39577.1 hypothetical protein A8B98_17980 [Hymenobacter sp. UV11]TFZ63320.1 glycosyltransferase [Hymenobacter sp. UV11]
MISIVIPTCNRNDLLSKCLDCLSPSFQTANAFSYEVIVTDDSIDNRAKKLVAEKYSWTTWIEGPKRGPAANRNNGARNTSGEWLLFIDDDCQPNPQLLKEYSDAANSNMEVLVFEGSISVDRPQRSFNEESPINETGGYLWSCNFMIKREVFFHNLDGFDEKFPYPAMEDVDLHYRLKRLGIKPLFLKSASVVHPWREQKKVLSTTLNRYKSTLYFLDKHPEMKAEINSLYYLRVFYHRFIKENIINCRKYRLRGILLKSESDFMHLLFSIHLLFRR